MRNARVHLTTTRNSLCLLPLSVVSTLSDRGVVPQRVVVEIKNGKESSFIGWSGLSASVTGFQAAPNDTLELDPLLARELKLRQDQKVC